MFNGFVWKPGISMRDLVPSVGMTEVIYHKNIYILLVDDVTLTVYKVMSFNIRSPLRKTRNRSVKTLGRECNLCVVISFIKQNHSSTYYVGLYTWLQYCHKLVFTSCRLLTGNDTFQTSQLYSCSKPEQFVYLDLNKNWLLLS